LTIAGRISQRGETPQRTKCVRTRNVFPAESGNYRITFRTLDLLWASTAMQLTKLVEVTWEASDTRNLTRKLGKNGVRGFFFPFFPRTRINYVGVSHKENKTVAFWEDFSFSRVEAFGWCRSVLTGASLETRSRNAVNTQKFRF